MSRSFGDEQIIESWAINARPWTVAVREGQIESRKRVTDQAILEAVLDRRPGSVLDIGCGEGWLVRELVAAGIQATGTDVVPELVETARRAGGGEFHRLSYEEIATGKLTASVDLVVCNFALLGKESVEGLFKAIQSLLNERGTFVVQTLHPVMACGEAPYLDGWREGSWAGFSKDFSNPAPWYFRTVESWIALFVESGFQLVACREPLHPQTGKPASIIFIAEPAGLTRPAGNKKRRYRTDR
ncbi:2-polyprenyl-3-methyl-5-hydroxy-6-metoxy-1,4-benzoquinol methylase [Natronocella acetinitrilica]|uniref:2-polyprenyl-3-methyl-5-hydroxy-6-metoxy-1, 4-benzoquinol methylase n=1 Tax=Natronocella acetinitrilica TaxID=414046 RepID=A0AAE3KD49_9GAMM|nr:methyltransferase domain-containing protein [Natronocella acetinitrilica]MCP1676431.1 2-polyprenyl-3-methyl-5-hydroxy-6-metoxy-1,4-benzoquinol methylase [Natronocella acetinitrilica]